MESLNDILGRQRRQQRPEQRPAQGNPHQEQRATQGAQGQPGHGPAPRRPLPEQSGRLGQPMPPHSSHGTYSGQQHNQQMPAKTRPPVQGKYDPTFSNTTRDLRESRSPYGASHSRPPQDMQRPTSGPTYQTRPRALPEPHNARNHPVPIRQQERPTQSLSRYHYTDDYTPALPADVVEDWEEEDDATGIRYGDWEEEEQDEGEVVIYQRTNVDAIPQPRRSYEHMGSMTRDFSQLDEIEEQARVTRNLRDLRMPVTTQPAASQALPPQALTREMQRYHRVTQPLNPRVVVEMNQEQETRHPVKPVRSVAPREQTKQREPHYISAAPVAPPMAPKSVCPRCKGAGYLRVDVPFGHPNFGKPTACSCKDNEKKEKRRQQLREMSNLDAFYDKTFRAFNTRVPGVQEAYQVAVDYAQGPAGWLLLVGPNGCGKTHLATAIANQGLEDGAVVLFQVVPDLLDHLRAAFAPTATEVYDQLFAKMREAELLVLDDLGAQQSSPWANEKLFQLLNYRYNMGMPTVITANPRGLQGIDERIRSRLTDISLVVTVHMDRARDYRPNHPRRD